MVHRGGMTINDGRVGPGLVRALLFVGLVCAALVFGLTLTHVLQDPGSRGLGGDEWLQVQHTFYGGFAVVGGASEIVGVVTVSPVAALRLTRGKIAAGVRSGVAALCLFGHASRILLRQSAHQCADRRLDSGDASGELDPLSRYLGGGTCGVGCVVRGGIRVAGGHGSVGFYGR